MTTFNFPSDFMFGTATAALQIEGGDRNNNWYEWCEMGKTLDGSHCIVANDHWNRIDQDIELMKDLNCQTYRLGLEWSRIMPTPTTFSAEAIQHYREEISKLIDAGIHPLVTLHHFTNPLWLEHHGAWTNPKSVEYFLKYTEYVVNELGDLVRDWVTINEPNVYLAMGYFVGIFPPGKKGSVNEYFKGAKNMILAHLQAYDMIHKMRSEKGFLSTKVGVAHHLRIFEPFNQNRLSKMSCGTVAHLFETIFLEGMTHGKIVQPLGKGFPHGERVFSDFIGLNYYSRDLIKGSPNPLTLFGDRIVKKGSPVNDLGWEIYPEGIYKISKFLYHKYKLPIFVTENGTADAKDAFRAQYIYDHLYHLHRAIEEGIPVQRYYHWTLMDNFEWLEGFSARFGLIHHDVETQERTIRQSGHFYSEICKTRSVSKEMLAKYKPAE